MSYEDVDPIALEAGTVIDGYTVVGRLGRGGMGAVYKVRRGDEHFALKISSERLASLTQAMQQQLERRTRLEVSRLYRLDHPNILRIQGSGRWPDAGG